MITCCYLLASVSFILGLKMLSDPAKARTGNLVAAAGMTLAIIATIFLYRDGAGHRLGNYGWIFGGIAIGACGGVLAARKVKMTAMPEMVSLFNGMGGLCAALISVVEFNEITAAGTLADGHLIIILTGLVIGAVSFAGSLVAWAKLNGRLKDFSFRGQQLLNSLLLLSIVSAAIILMGPTSGIRQTTSLLQPASVFYSLFLLSLIYGLFFVLPIGGADMPVVISLLNSFTGVAAACAGLLYDNSVMLTGGILVGAAGTLLTILMCRAMNRSLLNVLIGSFSATKTGDGGAAPSGVYKEIRINDAAVALSYAHKVMIVPGYGLAVAQAQHACHDLQKLLESKGVELYYAIHPVAGRMPGHMNVLLAEADVSYDKLLEMDAANEAFPTTDVVLVLGANDVVNPAALQDPDSPIYGMPVLELEQSKMVIVVKRSMQTGYAGIENALFFQPKTSMLFGDAKKVLQELIAAAKEL
ncbi:NAD(P)(+) transhydrogenase (Re/Si-specific) subunit beta [Niabella terrae]